jgi:hypothetical protein
MKTETFEKANKLRAQINACRVHLASILKHRDGYLMLGNRDAEVNMKYVGSFVSIPELKTLSDTFIKDIMEVLERKIKELETEFNNL